MSSTLKVAPHPPARAELVPQFFECDSIITPGDNPPCDPAVVARLVENIREHTQLVPGWVCPSPELEPGQRLCLEGNHRLAACRQLGIPFWAFDQGRHVPEEERIRLTFQHNHSRRVMSREEIAERAARFMELTGCPAFDAARMLGISGPTLSRAFSEQRIPAELKPRTDRLGLSIRSLIAAAPAAVMLKALEFAESFNADGKPKTRDQVAAYIRQLKKGSSGKGRKPKLVPLKQGRRTVTLAILEGDTAASVAEDLKAIAARLAKHTEVPPDGWPFLFQ